MCSVSVVMGGWTGLGSPNFIPWTSTVPAPDLAQQMLDVIERLERIDKRMGAIECLVEAKTKRAYKRKLKARAAASPSFKTPDPGV